MQTNTQIINLVSYPERKTIEFKVIFTLKDFQEASKLCIKYGDPVGTPLSDDTPLADRLQDMQLLMFRLEQSKAKKG